MNNSFEIFGVIGTAVVLLNTLPQIFRLLKYKRSDDISVWTYWILSLAMINFSIYSWSIGDKILLFSYVVGLLFYIITLFLIYKYRRNNDRLI